MSGPTRARAREGGVSGVSETACFGLDRSLRVLLDPNAGDDVATPRSSGAAEPACGYPRSPSDAPFVELHDRQSTVQLPTSNGAPPAASGTT